MEGTDRIVYLDAVNAVIGWLKSKGYPKERIVSELLCPSDNHQGRICYDIVVYDENKQVKRFFEIKTTKMRSGDYKKDLEKAVAYRAQIQSMATNDALGYLVLYDYEAHDFSLILLSKTISSLSEYVQLISDTHQSSEDFSYFFRGQDSLSYDLKPSLYRKIDLPSKEIEVFKEAIRRCPYEFEGLSSTFQRLVKLQHYGCPTRLLDLTSNALVALYFAVEDLNK